MILFITPLFYHIDPMGAISLTLRTTDLNKYLDSIILDYHKVMIFIPNFQILSICIYIYFKNDEYL